MSRRCAGVELEQFLEGMARRPFSDGEADCILTVADWVVANGHPDPAEPFRGRYRTALGRERIARREGGMLAVMEAGAARAGLEAAESPLRGDVGLVRMGDWTVAAICLGGLWAAKGKGLTVGPAEVLKAWRI